MFLRVMALLAVAAGLVWYFDLVPPSLRAGLGQAVREVENAAPQAAPAAMYKWTDANGRVVYGNEPPAGRKAERLSGERGSVSVVQATKVPPPPPLSASEPTMKDKMIDRVIEGPPPQR